MLEHQHRLDQAIVAYAEALRLDPAYTQARVRLEDARARAAAGAAP